METEYRDVGTIDVRYEDIAQDGRPLVECLPPSLGAVWRKIIANHPDGAKTQGLGIVPILSRIELQLSEESFSPMQRFEVEGRAAMLEADSAEDDYKRVLMDIETRVFGMTSHALLPRTTPSARRPVGSIRAEHVLTRLFAAKEKRRVTPDDVRAADVKIDAARAWERPQAIVRAPDGAKPIDSDFVRDESPLVMGLMHTDSNQHVNSLVYPRLFEEAVMRRLFALGRSRAVLARSLVIGWRRPSFAGDVLKVDLRLFETSATRLVAVGMFFGESENENVPDRDRARCYVRLDLAP